MNTIATRGDYSVITFGNSTTYHVVDNTGQSYKYYNSEKAAINYMNKVAEMAGQ